MLSVAGAKAFINAAQTFVFWIDIGSWFDITNGDFYPIDVEFPDVDLAVINVGGFGNIDATWQQIVPKIHDFYTLLGKVPNKIMDRFDAMIEGVLMDHSVSIFDLIPDIIPDDYNPPNYIGTFELEMNPKEEVVLYRNVSEVSEVNYIVVKMYPSCIELLA